MKMSLKIIIGICIVGLLLCVIGAFVSTTNDVAKNASATDTPVKYHQIGDTLIIDTQMFMVVGDAFYYDKEHFDVGDGNIAYGILIKIHNMDDREAYFDAEMLNVYADGVICNHFVFGDGYLDHAYINEDDNIYGWIYYTVPEDVRNIFVEYTPNNSDSESFKILFKTR